MGFNKIIQATFGSLNLFKRQLTKALLLPFILYVLVDVINNYEQNKIATILLSILSIIILTLIAISTHRIIILGENSVPEWGSFKWSKRESLFAFHIAALKLIILLFPLLFIAPTAVLIFTMCLISWIISRLSLVLPAIAIDKRISFKQSWDLTSNRQILMCLIILTFPAILFITVLLLSFIPYNYIESGFIKAIATIFTITAISISYMHINNERYQS